MDILLEDGTVWDGKDPEEPFRCHRLRFCQSCQSIMASPDRIRALDEKQGIRTCSGSVSCATKAMLCIAAKVYNRDMQGLISASWRERRDMFIKNPADYIFRFVADTKNRKWHDIRNLVVMNMLEFDVYTNRGMTAYHDPRLLVGILTVFRRSSG